MIRELSSPICLRDQTFLARDVTGKRFQLVQKSECLPSLSSESMTGIEFPTKEMWNPTRQLVLRRPGIIRALDADAAAAEKPVRRRVELRCIVWTFERIHVTWTILTERDDSIVSNVMSYE